MSCNWKMEATEFNRHRWQRLDDIDKNITDYKSGNDNAEKIYVDIQTIPLTQNGLKSMTIDNGVDRGDYYYENSVTPYVDVGDNEGDRFVDKRVLLQKYFRSALVGRRDNLYENLCRGCNYGVFTARGPLCAFCECIVSGVSAIKDSTSDVTSANIYENICEKCNRICSGGSDSNCACSTDVSASCLQLTQPGSQGQDNYANNSIINKQNLLDKTPNVRPQVNKQKHKILQKFLNGWKRTKSFKTQTLNGRNERKKSLEIIHHVNGFDQVFHTRDTFDLHRMCELKSGRESISRSDQHIYGRIKLKGDQSKELNFNTLPSNLSQLTEISRRAVGSQDSLLSFNCPNVNASSSPKKPRISRTRLLQSNSTSRCDVSSKDVKSFDSCKNITEQSGKAFSQRCEKFLNVCLEQWMEKLRLEVHCYRTYYDGRVNDDDQSICLPKPIPAVYEIFYPNFPSICLMNVESCPAINSDQHTSNLSEIHDCSHVEEVEEQFNEPLPNELTFNRETLDNSRCQIMLQEFVQRQLLWSPKGVSDGIDHGQDLAEPDNSRCKFTRRTSKKKILFLEQDSNSNNKLVTAKNYHSCDFVPQNPCLSRKSVYTAEHTFSSAPQEELCSVTTFTVNFRTMCNINLEKEERVQCQERGERGLLEHLIARWWLSISLNVVVITYDKLLITWLQKQTYCCNIHRRCNNLRKRSMLRHRPKRREQREQQRQLTGDFLMRKYRQLSLSNAQLSKELCHYVSQRVTLDSESPCDRGVCNAARKISTPSEVDLCGSLRFVNRLLKGAARYSGDKSEYSEPNFLISNINTTTTTTTTLTSTLTSQKLKIIPQRNRSITDRIETGSRGICWELQPCSCPHEEKNGSVGNEISVSRKTDAFANVLNSNKVAKLSESSVETIKTRTKSIENAVFTGKSSSLLPVFGGGGVVLISTNLTRNTNDSSCVSLELRSPNQFQSAEKIFVVPPSTLNVMTVPVTTAALVSEVTVSHEGSPMDEEEDSIYQPIWKFTTLGNVAEREEETQAALTDTTTHQYAEGYKTPGVFEAANGSSMPFILIEDHSKWLADDEFVFRHSVSNSDCEEMCNNGGDNSDNPHYKISKSPSLSMKSGNESVADKCSTIRSNLSLASLSSNSTGNYSVSGSTVTGFASSTATLASVASSSLQQFQQQQPSPQASSQAPYCQVGIFYSLTEPKLRAIVYDYKSLKASDYFMRRPMVETIAGNLTADHHQMQSSEDKLQTLGAHSDGATMNEATVQTEVHSSKTLDSRKNIQSSKMVALSDSVQAWKYQLLDVNYIEDEEDMIVSVCELLRAQEIRDAVDSRKCRQDQEQQQHQQQHQKQQQQQPPAEHCHYQTPEQQLQTYQQQLSLQQAPTVKVLQRFKSISSGNLIDLPIEDDKKTIAERMRNKLQRGVFKINTRSPKSEKKHSNRNIFRRAETTSLYLEDGLKPKYPLFGASLDQLELNQTTYPNVPRFVVDSVEYIERKDRIVQDGLYRACGNKFSIDELKQKLSESYIYDPKQLVADDIHTVTSLLKQFIRELSAPLIPQNIYERLGRNLHEENTAALIRDVFEDLIEPNYSTLKFIIKHLTNVAAFSSSNRMNAPNLAIVWGPCLLSIQQIDFDIGRMNTLVKILIENYDSIFASRSNERLVS